MHDGCKDMMGEKKARWVCFVSIELYNETIEACRVELEQQMVGKNSNIVTVGNVITL